MSLPNEQRVSRIELTSLRRGCDMEMKEECHGDLLIVHVCSSRIDASKAPEFRQEITSRIESGHTKLLLDFSMIDFIDSTGLGALAAWTSSRSSEPKGR
jgi:anti-anti-sigma factor